LWRVKQKRTNRGPYYCIRTTKVVKRKTSGLILIKDSDSKIENVNSKTKGYIDGKGKNTRKTMERKRTNIFNVLISNSETV
jgi:hypothetical protein